MIKVSSHPNLNAALQACEQTFGDSGGELVLDKPTVVTGPARYGRHGLSIRGEGNASPISVTFPSGDVLTFKRSDGSEIRNVLLRDFAILPTVARGAGWALRIDKGVRTTIDNVDLSSPEHPHMHHGGLWLNGYDDSNVNDCNIYARHKGILVNGTSTQSYGADVVIGGGTKIQNHRQPNMSDALAGAVGIHLAGGQGGTYIDATQMIFCGIGILIDRAVAGVTNREVFLNPGCVVDSCIEDGIRVMENAVGTVQATGLWSASHGRGTAGDAFRIHGTQHGTFHLTGSRLFNCKKGAGFVSNGGHSLLVGNVIDDNKIGIYKANPGAVIAQGLNLVHRNVENLKGL